MPPEYVPCVTDLQMCVYVNATLCRTLSESLFDMHPDGRGAKWKANKVVVMDR